MATSQKQNTVPDTETIVITNFNGALTRILNGDLNSGQAKFYNSWGYDPFSKPGNLTWLEQPTSVLNSSTDLLLAGKPYFSGNVQKIYAISNSGKLYAIQPNLVGSPSNPNYDHSSVAGSVLSGGVTYTYGASMEIAGVLNPTTSSVVTGIYIGSDSQVNSVFFDGSVDTPVAVSQYCTPTGHSVKAFTVTNSLGSGTVVFSNGNTVGAIAPSSGIVTSSVIGTGQAASGGGPIYSNLNPPLPPNAYIHDLDISKDGNYLMMATSTIPNEVIATKLDDIQNGASTDSALWLWNGSDGGITQFYSIPSYAVTSFHTYLQNNLFFANDSFGASMNDGTNKILSLPNSKPPLPNTTAVNGNFITWATVELNAAGTGMVCSLYYFGNLDQENPSGLWRVMQFATQVGGFIYQVPLNLFANGKYSTINNFTTAVSTYSLGKHYISVMDVTSASTAYYLLSFLITPSGSGTPQAGVYETQTQLFSQKITIKEIRVYTEPTAANQGFQLDFIDSAGNVITPANGVFTYTYAAGTDITKLQGSLERINYNPQMKDTYALGIRITNTGTVNMTIHKIEIDYTQSGQ